MRLLGPLVFAAAAAVLTSCATPTAGQAVAGNDVDSTSRSNATPRATSSPRTSASSPASPLADIDPCTLLTAAAKGKLGITTEGERTKIVNSRVCAWRLRGPQTTYIFSVGLLDKAGIKNIPTEVEIEKLPNIGDHEAVRNKGGAGTRACAIVLGVTDSSRADIQAVAGADQDKACELVMQLATLVEPELP